MIPTIDQNRALLAHHLSGCGIEFGGLYGPLRVPAGVKVRYADHNTVERSREKYGEQPFVNVDILLDTNFKLDEIEDEGEDFIIANQVIEHLPNPIGAMRIWARKLKPGGVLYLSFPLGPYTPDKARPTTSLAHLLADDARNTTDASHEHLMGFIDGWNPNYFPDRENIASLLKRMRIEGREFLNAGDKVSKANRDAIANMNPNEEIHHHVFEMHTLVGAAQAACADLQPFDCSLSRGLFNEHICVFRKGGDAAQAARSFRAAVERETMLNTVIQSKEDLINHLIGQVEAKKTA
jgi:SAM-dependent methyltransferase